MFFVAIIGLSRTHDNDKRPRGWKMIKNSLFIYLCQLEKTSSVLKTVAAHVERGANGSFGDNSIRRRADDKETRATMTFNEQVAPAEFIIVFNFFPLITRIIKKKTIFM